MPNLGGTPQRRKINLSSRANSGVAEDEEQGAQRRTTPASPQQRRASTRTPPPRPVRPTLLDDEDDDDADTEDEIIQTSIQSSQNKKIDPKLMILLGCGVVVLVVMAFLLLGGKKETQEPYTPPSSPSEPAPVVTPPETYNDSNLGIQDFSQNTTMQSSSPLTDPNGFVEDLYGLTTRVDYSVASIQSNVVDFVNYTKKRGTWGGGLELYYLDATYKGNQYVVQVPFQYYKELDDEGIVPVKMEVLYVKEANGETLSIISYMCLDESTLKTLLKTKK